jgi:hypothetical protein
VAVTISEILTHALAAATGAAPLVGYVVRQRARASTDHAAKEKAEAQAEHAEAETVRLLATEALERAKKAEERAEKAQERADKAEEASKRCEDDRERCELRTRALYRELTDLRRELELSGTLKSDPERRTPPEVIEAWANRAWAKEDG